MSSGSDFPQAPNIGIIRDNGTDKPVRGKLNFVGATLTDDASNNQTTVTIAASASTLSAVYNAGATSADQTLTLASGKGSGLIIKDAGTSVGSLLKLTDNGSTNTYFNVVGNGQITLKSAQAVGSTPAFVFDTVNATWGNSNYIYQWGSGGQPAMKLVHDTSTVLNFFDTSGTFLNGWVATSANHMQMNRSAASLLPGGDKTSGLGSSAARWRNSYSAAYYSVQNVITPASSITIDPTAGEEISITLSSTTISTVTFSAGSAGQRMYVYIKQDNPARSFPTTFTGALIQGGTYTVTNSAFAVDILLCVWTSTAGTWLVYPVKNFT